jgi:hypothetical protein
MRHSLCPALLMIGSGMTASAQDIAGELPRGSRDQALGDPSASSARTKGGRGRDFLKTFSIESFGLSAARTGPGFESPTRLSSGPFTTHEFECPRCTVAPSMGRMRYTLPAFGAVASLKLRDGRAELFTGNGGMNAWRPENSIIDVDGGGLFRRNSSFNDAWLVQGVAGFRFALDKKRRLWLGGTARYVTNYGSGPKHWKSVGVSLTYEFGR